jgi:hypothetical protein
MTIACDDVLFDGESPTLPRWVRLLDATALLRLLIAAMLIPGDGIRLELGHVRVSITSALRLVFWAGVVITARHAFYRQPLLTTRVLGWLRSDVLHADVRFVSGIMLATRIPPILIGLLTIGTIGVQTLDWYQPYQNPWLNLPARWDSLWYTQIAAFGYSWDGNPLREQSVVFFPGYPLLIQAVTRFMSSHVFYAAWAVSLTAFACAVPMLLRLARHLVGDKVARDSVWLLAAYPFAIYFSAAYSESVFLLMICGAFLAAVEHRFGRAALWGLAAGLTRPNGWLLAVPLMLIVFYRQPWPATTREKLSRAAVVTSPVAGVLLFTLYLYLQFGDGFAWVRGQAAWGRVFRGLHLFAADRFLYLRDMGLVGYLLNEPFDALNTAAAFLALGSAIPIARRLGLAYGALMVVMILPPLLMGGATSIGRMTSILFPLFIWLAAILRDQQRIAVITTFATLQGFAAVLFFSFRQLY